MKISSVKKNRIRTSFVDRHTIVNKAKAVESISSIKGIKNASYYSSENHLMSYDEFYDNFKELKKEYKKFYHDEQIFKDAIDNFDINRNELLSNMRELIIKYNNAIESLNSFDKAFGTDYVKKIQSILVEFKEKLAKLGINIVEDKNLELKEKIFIEAIETNKNVLDLLFQPTKGVILKIYAAFRNIKISKESNLEKKYEDNYRAGMLLDDKT